MKVLVKTMNLFVQMKSSVTGHLRPIQLDQRLVPRQQEQEHPVQLKRVKEKKARYNNVLISPMSRKCAALDGSEKLTDLMVRTKATQWDFTSYTQTAVDEEGGGMRLREWHKKRKPDQKRRYNFRE